MFVSGILGAGFDSAGISRGSLGGGGNCGGGGNGKMFALVSCGGIADCERGSVGVGGPSKDVSYLDKLKNQEMKNDTFYWLPFLLLQFSSVTCFDADRITFA